HHVARMATFARGQTLTLRDLERYGDLRAPSSSPAPAPTPTISPGVPGPAAVDSLEETERKQIVLALEKAGGNKTKAAELLGINRVTLFRKLRRFEMES